MPTPWRRGLYKEIAKLEVSGKVLDLGGSRKSGYHELIGGTHTIDVVNIDDSSGLDLKFDLEEKFPIQDATYDAVLAMNVLEHIFNHTALIGESFRVLRPGGSIIIGVPFLMHVHPSPHDYWRYTNETLEELLVGAGFNNIDVQPVGYGPFTASVQLLSGIVRVAAIRDPLEYLARFLDRLLGLVSKNLPDRYPLGYLVRARK